MHDMCTVHPHNIEIMRYHMNYEAYIERVYHEDE